MSIAYLDLGPVQLVSRATLSRQPGRDVAMGVTKLKSLVAPPNLAKVEQAYDSDPWWYDLRGLGILWLSYRSTLIRQIRFFSKNISDRHLEAAVGSGTLLEMTLKWRSLFSRTPTGRVIAFDYSERMLGGARRRFKRQSNIEILRADVGTLPFPDRTFLSVNIANAIHCFSDIEGALREIFRVLDRGGTLRFNGLLHPTGLLAKISDRINQWGINKGILHSPYDARQLEDLCRKAGFEVTISNQHGNCLYVEARRPD